MVIEISKSKILEYKKLELISELGVIREKILLFEKKYKCSLPEFKQKMESQEEDFEQWDDFIEWNGYNSFKIDLEKELDEIEHARDIKIID